jgi:hypothetical protein
MQNLNIAHVLKIDVISEYSIIIIIIIIIIIA